MLIPILDPDICACLGEVIDPELGINIVDLGLVLSATRSGAAIEIVFTLTSRACPLGSLIRDDVRERLGAYRRSIADEALVLDGRSATAEQQVHEAERGDRIATLFEQIAAEGAAAPLSDLAEVRRLAALVQVDEQAEARDALAAMRRLRITAFAFVAPTMIVRLLEARPRDDIGSLRGVIYGGATIHLEHIKAAVQRFGPIFHQLYGQGEAPMTISYLPGADHLGADDETLLSAGYVRAGVEVRLVDENDMPVAPGADGEICVRGDVVMKGYWGNPAATEAALKGGWLYTGDVGHFDSGGRLRVLDRRHDTIISGGTNIYPKEIEDVIAAHPGVREVIAFGLPDREWGESVAVAIVADEAARPSEADILAFCRQSLASFKKPKHVLFLDELPKSAYGKVLRRELKARFSGA